MARVTSSSSAVYQVFSSRSNNISQASEAAAVAIRLDNTGGARVFWRIIITKVTECNELQGADQWWHNNYLFIRLHERTRNLSTYSAAYNRSFSASGPHLWINQPKDLRQAGLSYEHFKRQLKSYLFKDHGAL